MSDYCPNCGTDRDRHFVPVWQDKADHDAGDQPDFIGCTNCHQMHRPHLLRDDEDETPPQAKLTDTERQRLASRGIVGNQNNSKLTIIEWQCVKGAAIYYGVTDWLAKVDATLTAEENVSLMERHGTRNKTTTMRHLESPGEYKSRDEMRGESDA